MADLSPFLQAQPGGNITTPAAAAAHAQPADTPAFDGAAATAPKPDAGAMTSRHSRRRNIPPGNGAEPQHAAPREIHIPYAVAVSAGWLFEEMQALELYTFDGAGRLSVGATDHELQPGRWIVCRLADEADQLPANTLYEVPDSANA